VRVFVAGGTGVLGRRLVPLLVDAGHSVTVTARSSQAEQRVLDFGAKPVDVSLFDREAARAAVRGFDAVVNIATHVPGLTGAARRGAWRENDRLRDECTRVLGDAARMEDVPRYIRDSLTFVYPDRGAEWIDEAVPPEPNRFLAAVLAGESHVRRYAAGGGDGIVLRFGLFYGPDGRHAEDIRRLAHVGVGTVVGPPEAYLSVVHVDDAATAVLAALAVPDGLYNVVDDHPPTRAEYVAAQAAALGAQQLRPPPRVIGRLARSMTETMSRSQRVSNERFRSTSGWQPAHPDSLVGWRSLG
jgi:nucleoside-diphosphate-sugar epimerase